MRFLVIPVYLGQRIGLSHEADLPVLAAFCQVQVGLCDDGSGHFEAEMITLHTAIGGEDRIERESVYDTARTGTGCAAALTRRRGQKDESTTRNESCMPAQRVSIYHSDKEVPRCRYSLHETCGFGAYSRAVTQSHCL